MSRWRWLTVRRKDLAPALVLGVAMLAYVVNFGYLTWEQQTNFGTFGYDMGIYDQGIWLLSRFQEPFLTVRGLPYFGHHVNLSTVFLVPFYWLGAGPRFLYLFETLALALGAIPLWLIARRRLGSVWFALVPAFAYLLYPSLEWINWWHFHPDALIITPLLFSWWFALTRRWRLFTVAVALALLAKEDAAMAVAVLGVLLAVRATIGKSGVNRRGQVAGLATSLAGVAWWLICTRLIIPYMNHGAEPFYAHLFPGFGETSFEVVRTILTQPSTLIRAVSTPEHGEYYLKLFGPTAFLSLFSPVSLLAAPQLLVNSISAHGYTHDFRYHYNSVVIAGVFLGTIEAMGWMGRRWLIMRVVLPVVVAASSLTANVLWSPSPLGRQFHSGIWAQPVAKHRAVRAALELIPDEAGVTASYYIVPHLTHRRLIYEFPNPFRVANWGIAGENPGDPAGVDYLVIDTRFTGSDTELYRRLTSQGGPFEVIFAEDQIEVARRKR